MEAARPASGVANNVKATEKSFGGGHAALVTETVIDALGSFINTGMSAVNSVVAQSVQENEPGMEEVQRIVTGEPKFPSVRSTESAVATPPHKLAGTP